MTFEATLLPDTEKEILALGLLDEFGANNVKVNRASGKMMHSCILPFGGHSNGDANPSAFFHYKKLYYKCYGCGSGGGLLWFIQVMRGLGSDHKAARAWLNKQTGLGQEVMDLSDLLRYFDSLYTDLDVHPSLPHYSHRVLDPWLVIHPYLTEQRHIPEETITRFRVGWDEARDRIIIPHFEGETLVGWQARRLDPNDRDKTKYRNSPDFPKDDTIFNYNWSASWPVVVESPMSVLRHAHHLDIEATFGASVTDRQITLLSKHETLVLWFDNDTAGWKATEHVGGMLARYSNVFVVENPYAADAGDIDDKDASLLVSLAVPWSVWERPTSLNCYTHKTPIRECCAKEEE